MREYWENPQETAEVLRDGQFKTGDIGRRDAEGYFYVLDRLKDMIVTGGENVYSSEVEAVIYQHPAVREAARVSASRIRSGVSSSRPTSSSSRASS